jgi:hypothetical protein
MSSARTSFRKFATGLRLLLAASILTASILGAVLGVQSILCIEADGQSHFEVPAETCCTIAQGLDPCGTAGMELQAGTACQDCRDFVLANVVQGRPADRSSTLRPASSSAIPFAALAPASAGSSFTGASHDLVISPVLLSLRTVVLSC